MRSSMNKKNRLWLVVLLTVTGAIAVIAGISNHATKTTSIAMSGDEAGEGLARIS